ncbi:MAG: TIR domain-containing protein [Candidatus Lokiarchaeota archaeon]|nr:TIR domain-containing protein [Candidatus Lokiarchaeota archaeon]
MKLFALLEMDKVDNYYNKRKYWHRWCIVVYAESFRKISALTIENIMISKTLKKYLERISRLKIFISFCSEDDCQAKFLFHVLKYYKIETFFSPVHCEIGKRYTDDIIKNLRDSTTLIVIITKNTCKSSWVTKEIDIFKKKSPGKKIIPLIFNQTDLEMIYSGLSKYSYVDFSDWTDGFTNLCRNFGIKFLDNLYKDLSIERRINQIDRRSNDVRFRLQTSFWKCYSKAFNLSIKDEVKLNKRAFFYFNQAILVEAKNYFYFDNDGNLYNPINVINRHSEKVWAYFKSKSQNNHAKVIDLTILLADLLVEDYRIFWKDRRKENISTLFH